MVNIASGLIRQKLLLGILIEMVDVAGTKIAEINGVKWNIQIFLEQKCGGVMVR